MRHLAATLLLVLLAAPVARAQYVVSVMGDSNTEGVGIPGVTTPWPTTLGTLLGAGYTVINNGVSGERVMPTVAGACSPHPVPCTFSGKYCNVVAADDPNAITFMGGTNDLRTPAATAVEIWRIYEPILDSAWRIQGLKVVAMAVVPAGGSSGWTGAKQTELDALNALLSAWVSAHAGACYVDTYNALDTNADDVIDAAYNSGDNLHLSQAGMDLVAGLVDGCFP